MSQWMPPELGKFELSFTEEAPAFPPVNAALDLTFVAASDSERRRTARYVLSELPTKYRKQRVRLMGERIAKDNNSLLPEEIVLKFPDLGKTETKPSTRRLDAIKNELEVELKTLTRLASLEIDIAQPLDGYTIPHEITAKVGGARIMLKEVIAHLKVRSSLEKVHFVLVDEAALKTFEDAYRELTGRSPAGPA